MRTPKALSVQLNTEVRVTDFQTCSLGLGCEWLNCPEPGSPRDPSDAETASQTPGKSLESQAGCPPTPAHCLLIPAVAPESQCGCGLGVVSVAPEDPQCSEARRDPPGLCLRGELSQGCTSSASWSFLPPQPPQFRLCDSIP